MGGAERYPSIASYGDDGVRRLILSYVLGVSGMRFSIIAVCLVATGCSSAPPVDRGPSANVYQKDIEDQLGITRARQRQEACSRLPLPAIGMSAAQVVASCWGKPDHAAEETTARGKTAVWGYPEGYVYLADGTVTKIVTSR
jgi:hypothetical protein